MNKCRACSTIFFSPDPSDYCPVCEDTQRRLNEKLSERIKRSVMGFAQVCHWMLSGQGQGPRRIRRAWRAG